MKINLNNDSLDNLPVEILKQNCRGISKQYFTLQSGKEPYRLLFFLAQQFNNSLFIDLGTSNGASALALSNNKSNQVMSFDIFERSETSYLQNKEFERMPRIENIDFIISENFIKYMDLFLTSPLIYVDIAHDGVWEKILIDKLIKFKYKGLVIFDDIYEFDEMLKLWNSIELKKIDLTKYGHWSGTGLIDFNSEIEFILE